MLDTFFPILSCQNRSNVHLFSPRRLKCDKGFPEVGFTLNFRNECGFRCKKVWSFHFCRHFWPKTAFSPAMRLIRSRRWIFGLKLERFWQLKIEKKVSSIFAKSCSWFFHGFLRFMVYKKSIGKNVPYKKKNQLSRSG